MKMQHLVKIRCRPLIESLVLHRDARKVWVSTHVHLAQFWRLVHKFRRQRHQGIVGEVEYLERSEVLEKLVFQSHQAVGILPTFSRQSGRFPHVRVKY